MKASLPLFACEPYRALIIGSSGSIGGAFVRAFESDPGCTHVECISRSTAVGFDLANPASICAQADRAATQGPYAIMVDATGALSIRGQGPEKALHSLDAEQLMQTYVINTIGPAMVLRYFAPLLAKGPSVYAKLSARVGSITDNRKGGWYGYRSAKAGLNMILQTAAIELQRKNPALRVVALQPGTVQSKLSAPFTTAAHQVLTPEASVYGMLTALKALPAKPGACFLDYQGKEIPW